MICDGLETHLAVWTVARHHDRQAIIPKAIADDWKTLQNSSDTARQRCLVAHESEVRQIVSDFE